MFVHRNEVRARETGVDTTLKKNKNRTNDV